MDLEIVSVCFIAQAKGVAQAKELAPCSSGKFQFLEQNVISRRVGSYIHLCGYGFPVSS